MKYWEDRTFWVHGWVITTGIRLPLNLLMLPQLKMSLCWPKTSCLLKVSIFQPSFTHFFILFLAYSYLRDVWFVPYPCINIEISNSNKRPPWYNHSIAITIILWCSETPKYLNGWTVRAVVLRELGRYT